MYISSPLSYPISIFLDYLLGIHTKNRFLNNDLKALIELHTTNALKNMNFFDGFEEKADERIREEIGLDQEQANLMISAIEMGGKKTKEKMIPIDKVFMFDYNHAIENISDIYEGEYSIIPIYENDRSNIVG